MNNTAVFRNTGTEIGKLVSLILLTALVLTAALFLTRAYRRSEDAASRYWYSRGQEAYRAGDFGSAVNDFRTALESSHGDSRYQLSLAQALARLGRLGEAQSYFTLLLHDQPGSGVVNLELARIAVRRHDPANALRFFHGAIYGVWDGDPLLQRINVRFELIEYLISIGQTQQADSELIAVASELPEQSELHARAGALYSQVGDEQRALAEFTSAVHVEPNNQNALLGGGQAALDLGRYALARGYFERAQTLAETDRASTALKQIDTIQSLDPFSQRLPYRERVNRTLTLFRVAGDRLQACSASGDARAGDLSRLLGDWQEFRPQVTQSALRRDPDLLDRSIELALKAEEKTTEVGCPISSPEDSAILNIARSRSLKQ